MAYTKKLKPLQKGGVKMGYRKKRSRKKGYSKKTTRIYRGGLKLT